MTNDPPRSGGKDDRMWPALLATTLLVLLLAGMLGAALYA